MWVLFVICGVDPVDAKAKTKKSKKVKKSSTLDLDADVEKAGAKKLAKIEALEAKSSDHIIEFTPQQFRELVVQNPRPYDVVTIFNVDQNCDHCIEFQNEYKQVVYSFIKERGTVQGQEKEKKLFFGLLKFGPTREI